MMYDAPHGKALLSSVRSALNTPRLNSGALKWYPRKIVLLLASQVSERSRGATRKTVSLSVYIPTAQNHLHGDSEPRYRLNRAAFTEGEPFI